MAFLIKPESLRLRFTADFHIIHTILLGTFVSIIHLNLHHLFFYLSYRSFILLCLYKIMVVNLKKENTLTVTIIFCPLQFLIINGIIKTSPLY